MDRKTFKRFLKRKSSVVGGIIIIIFVSVAIFGPLLIDRDPLEMDLRNTYQKPNKDHWFGTDNLGRDTFTRLVFGARITLIISFAGVLIGTIFGLILGVISGFYGGVVDTILMRSTDILLAFPGLLLAIAIVAILGSGIFNTILAIAFYSIPYIARIVRGVVISIKELEYIKACEVMGCSHFTTIVGHIIPNSMSQLIVNTTLNLGTAILTSSALSFLGLGVQPPHPEWGAMLSTARDVMRSNPIAALIPGVAITLVVLSFSMLGDGLRDALDPKLKNN